MVNHAWETYMRDGRKKLGRSGYLFRKLSGLSQVV